MEDKFMINTDNIFHIANSEENISKTIEELLKINNKIPARKKEDYESTTEKQLEKEKYINKNSRGEKEEITEIQLGERENEYDDDIIEISLEEADKEMGGHRPEAWEPNEDKVRGHKDVPPIWLEVYRIEDERKGK